MKSDYKEFEFPEFFETNFELLEVDALEFVYSETSGKLNETVRIFELMSTRAYNLIRLVVPLLVGLVIFIINEKTGNSTYKEFFLPATGCIAFLLISLINLLFVIWGEDVHTLGSDPDELLDPDFFSTELANKQKKNLLLNQIYSFQTRIDHNRTLNSKRHKLYQNSLIFILGIFSTPLLLIF